MSNANFNTLIASTLQNFSNKIMDNVITNNTTLYFLKQKGNYKVVSGGRQFVEQIWWRANPTFAARAHLDTITPQITDGHTASEWNIKTISGAIAISRRDVAMNSGSKEQLFDLVKAKMTEAEVSMAEVIGDQLYNTAVGSNDFDSIPRIISLTPSTDTDVGGIDSSTTANAYWRNVISATTIGTFNSNQAGFNAIDTALNSATKGNKQPRLMVTTSAIFTLFQLGLTNLQRYTNAQDNGNIGFKTLEYAGIPVVFDDNAPTGRLYGIDTEAIKMKVLSQGDMKQTPFQVSTTQLVDTALLYLFGNLTCDSRRTNFVINSITG